MCVGSLSWAHPLFEMECLIDIFEIWECLYIVDLSNLKSLGAAHIENEIHIPRREKRNTQTVTH